MEDSPVRQVVGLLERAGAGGVDGLSLFGREDSDNRLAGHDVLAGPHYHLQVFPRGQDQIDL